MPRRTRQVEAGEQGDGGVEREERTEDDVDAEEAGEERGAAVRGARSLVVVADARETLKSGVLILRRSGRRETRETRQR